jgi:hypothetical protein
MGKNAKKPYAIKQCSQFKSCVDTLHSYGEYQCSAFSVQLFRHRNLTNIYCCCSQVISGRICLKWWTTHSNLPVVVFLRSYAAFKSLDYENRRDASIIITYENEMSVHFYPDTFLMTNFVRAILIKVYSNLHSVWTKVQVLIKVVIDGTIDCNRRLNSVALPV